MNHGCLGNEKMYWCFLVCGVLLILSQPAECACQFPGDLRTNWTSSNFGAMEFEASVVNFTADTMQSWTCHLSSSNQYIIRSSGTLLSVGQLAYIYYCLEISQQNTNSFLYYVLSVNDATGMIGSKVLGTLVDVTTITDVCNSTQKNTAQFHVMIRTGSEESAQQKCVTPLLGSFNYTLQTVATSSTTFCGSYPGDGIATVCDNAGQSSLVFNLTLCTQTIAASTSGMFLCIASVTGSVGTSTVYYQTLYNTDALTGSPTYTFVCMATSFDTVNGETVVNASYSPNVCDESQTAASTSSAAGGTLVMKAYETCATTDEEADNTGLIVGLVIGLLLLAAIIAGLLLYFCWWKKRDPNAGKPIVENTKPRFEDPDKEDILEDLEVVDTRSTPITRDEIIFETNSPTFMANGKITPIQNGGTFSPNSSSKMANGSMRRDSGIGTEMTRIDRPTPRIGINPNKEAMVIFDGGEKMISGNDTRIIPINKEAAPRKMDSFPAKFNPLLLAGLEDLEAQDEIADLSPSARDNIPYPTLPREKSNLMPPADSKTPR